MPYLSVIVSDDDFYCRVCEAQGMHPLGVECLCLFGMPPDEHVPLAAELGCDVVGIVLEAELTYNPHGYAPWSLMRDAALRRRVKTMLHDRGVTIGLCEGFTITRGRDVREQATALDVAAELGAQRINVLSLTRDTAFALDGFARIAEMAGERGLRTVTEIGMSPVATLDAALHAVAHVGRPDFGLLIDTMHFFRLGGSVAAVAAIDPSLIGYVQLCDAPHTQRFETYIEEALYERMVPGEGELPLAPFLKLVPAGVPVSVEVPRRSLAAQGIGAAARVAPCVEAARAMLGQR